MVNAGRFPGASLDGTDFTGTALQHTNAQPFAIKGTQTTRSEGHPYRRKNRPSGDVGGEFFTQRTYVKGLEKTQHIKWVEREEGGPPNSKATLKGSVGYFPITVSAASGVLVPEPTPSSNSDLDKAGTTAIARCKPTNPVGDASVFLGELYREGLPHLLGSHTWQGRNKLAKDAGSDYLNLEFGWKPLIADIRSFAYGVSHADTVLAQYERDSGRQVRRRFSFPAQVTTSEREFNAPNSGFGFQIPFSSNALFHCGTGRVVETLETTKTQWFSGAFTYHIPFGMSTRTKMGQYALYAKQVLGLELTPEVLWNLSPWSWAVDWFSNTGDVVSNLSDWAQDGLVMRYGYMMETTINKATYSWKPMTTVSGKPVPSPLEFVTITKTRRRANPFGFGLTWEGLTPRQVAITVALGLSRI